MPIAEGDPPQKPATAYTQLLEGSPNYYATAGPAEPETHPPPARPTKQLSLLSHYVTSLPQTACAVVQSVYASGVSPRSTT